MRTKNEVKSDGLRGKNVKKVPKNTFQLGLFGFSAKSARSPTDHGLRADSADSEPFLCFLEIFPSVSENWPEYDLLKSRHILSTHHVAM